MWSSTGCLVDGPAETQAFDGPSASFEAFHPPMALVPCCPRLRMARSCIPLLLLAVLLRGTTVLPMFARFVVTSMMFMSTYIVDLDRNINRYFAEIATASFA